MGDTLSDEDRDEGAVSEDAETLVEQLRAVV